MFVFGKRSLREIKTLHKDLQLIFFLAIKKSKIDFGLSEGYRSIKKQIEYYSVGRTTQLHRSTITNVDGVNRISKHNKKPSEAGDIYIYHIDSQTRQLIAFSKIHLGYIAGIIDASAEELYECGEIEHLIRWGANWDRDGIIALDQSFDDYPHFEIYKP